VEQSHQDFERFERRQEACRSVSQALIGLYASFAANWTAVQQRESSADSKMYAALYNAVPYVDVDAIAFLKVVLSQIFGWLRRRVTSAPRASWDDGR
jgi:hypothetical protein